MLVASMHALVRTNDLSTTGGTTYTDFSFRLRNLLAAYSNPFSKKLQSSNMRSPAREEAGRKSSHVAALTTASNSARVGVFEAIDTGALMSTFLRRNTYSFWEMR